LGDGVLSPKMTVAVPRSEAASSMELGWPFKSVQNHMGNSTVICGKRTGIRLLRGFTENSGDAREALNALEAACVEISESSSITNDEGYLILSPSGVRLHDTDYVRELVARYHAAKHNKEAIRKRLIDLGEPDPG